MAKVFEHDTGGTLTTGLISYYKEEDATDYYDSHNLTDVGTPTYVAAKVNNGVHFVSANGQYQDGGNVADFNFERTSPFSVSLWAKRNEQSSLYSLVSKTNANNGWEIFFYTTTLRVVLRSNNGDNLIYKSVAFDETAYYHHIVVTYDGSSTAAGLKIYVDNSQPTATVLADALNYTMQSTAAFQIGNNNMSWFQYGTEDEIGIWNRVLNATPEIADLWYGGAGQTMVVGPSTYTENVAMTIVSVIAKTEAGLFSELSKLATVVSVLAETDAKTWSEDVSAVITSVLGRIDTAIRAEVPATTIVSQLAKTDVQGMVEYAQTTGVAVLARLDAMIHNEISKNATIIAILGLSVDQLTKAIRDTVIKIIAMTPRGSSGTVTPAGNSKQDTPF